MKFNDMQALLDAGYKVTFTRRGPCDQYVPPTLEDGPIVAQIFGFGYEEIGANGGMPFKAMISYLGAGDSPEEALRRAAARFVTTLDEQLREQEEQTRNLQRVLEIFKQDQP